MELIYLKKHKVESLDEYLLKNPDVSVIYRISTIETTTTKVIRDFYDAFNKYPFYIYIECFNEQETSLKNLNMKYEKIIIKSNKRDNEMSTFKVEISTLQDLNNVLSNEFYNLAVAGFMYFFTYSNIQKFTNDDQLFPIPIIEDTIDYPVIWIGYDGLFIDIIINNEMHSNELIYKSMLETFQVVEDNNT